MIEAMRNRGLAYNVLNDWQKKFLKSVSVQRKLGRSLSEKQNEKLVEILMSLVNNDVITRDCIDGDSEYCNIILDALGK